MTTAPRDAGISLMNLARAGQHGREFAVVANVLSGITHQIDHLSLQAVSLAVRNRTAA